MPAATNETRSNVRKTLKKLGQDVSERLRRAEILLNVYQRTAGLDSLDDVLATIVDIAIHETTSEAGTLFLHDETTGELYSRVTQGSFKREFRIRATKGIAGNVFTNGKGQIIPDAYKDKRFDPTIDQQTGFTTRAILCAPVKTVRGDVIGVVQVLNKQIGDFTRDDLALLEAMATQASDSRQISRTLPNIS